MLVGHFYFLVIFVQVLKDLMGAIDVDGSGSVNLDEWIKGGMNNVPLLVLLGLKVVAHHARHQHATLLNVIVCKPSGVQANQRHMRTYEIHGNVIENYRPIVHRITCKVSSLIDCPDPDSFQGRLPRWFSVKNDL